VVVSVSAPTSLAIDTADALGVTLAGFTRGDAFNLYTHPERIV
jgi:FdhD protein